MGTTVKQERNLRKGRRVLKLKRAREKRLRKWKSKRLFIVVFIIASTLSFIPNITAGLYMVLLALALCILYIHITARFW